jgi:hypothetical protein
MIYQLRLASRCATIMLGKALDIRPVREKPGFELVLRGMRKEPVVCAHPLTHPPLGISGIDEVTAAGVHIGQGDHSIGARFQMPMDIAS